MSQSDMSELEIELPRTVITGAGAVKRVAELAHEHGKRCLLVLARSFSRSAAADELSAYLVSIGVEAVKVEPVHGEPTVELVDELAAAGREGKVDVVISIGGGSTMDAGKAASMLIANSGSAADYQMGKREIRNPATPGICVPTTAGTGSEGNHVSVLTNVQEGVKKSVRHASMVPFAAILDAELGVSLPPRWTALCAMDALSHAMESYVSKRANPFCEAFGIKAIKLIGENLLAAVRDGQDLQARENLLVASFMGGVALRAGVGAMHLLGPALNSSMGLPHGQSIGVLMHAVVVYNEVAAPEKYAEVARALGGEKASEAVSKLLSDSGLGQINQECRISETEMEHTLRVAVPSMSRHGATNPRPLTEDSLRDILSSSLSSC